MAFAQFIRKFHQEESGQDLVEYRSGSWLPLRAVFWPARPVWPGLLHLDGFS